MIRRAALLLSLALLGCQAHHYVVVRDRTPLYANSTSSEIVTRLPRYHHEPLDAVVGPSERVPVRYKGRNGYVSREAVRVFSYLHPLIDGGEDKDEVVQQQLREAQIDSVGGEWPRSVKRAIRKQEVHEGMTRRQVELAWGWPLTVQPGKLPSGERWVYRFDRSETIRQFLSDPWSSPSSYSPYLPSDGFGARRPWPREGWVELRLPVTEERVVELDSGGRVAAVSVRRFLKDD